MQADYKFPFYQDPVTGDCIRTSVPFLDRKVEMKFVSDYVPPKENIDWEQYVKKPAFVSVVVNDLSQTAAALSQYEPVPTPGDKELLHIPVTTSTTPIVPPPVDVLHLHKENTAATQLECPIEGVHLVADLHHDIPKAEKVGTNREALAYALAMYCSSTGICLARTIGLFNYTIIKLGGIYTLKTWYRWNAMDNPIYTPFYFDKPLWYSIVVAHLVAVRLYGVYYLPRTMPIKVTVHTSRITKQDVWFLSNLQRFFPRGGHDAFMDATDGIKEAMVRINAHEDAPARRLQCFWMVDKERTPHFGEEESIGTNFLDKIMMDVQSIGMVMLMEKLKDSTPKVGIFSSADVYGHDKKG